MNKEDCVGIRPRSTILSMNEDCLYISRQSEYTCTYTPPVYITVPINSSRQKSGWKSIRCCNWHRRRQDIVSRFLQANGTLSVRDNGRRKAHIGTQQRTRQWHEMQPSDESDENRRAKIEPVSFCTSADSRMCGATMVICVDYIDVLGFHRIFLQKYFISIDL